MARRSYFGQIASLAFLAIFFYQPLFHTLSHGEVHQLSGVLLSAQTLKILWFTAWQAALSMVIAVALALPCAYIFFRHRAPLGKAMGTLIAVPFVLPSIVVAVALKSLFASQGLWVLIAGNVFMNCGFAARIIGSAWREFDPSIDEAAELDGAGRFRTFISLNLKDLASSLRSACLLVFIYCAANFGLVMVLGTPSNKTLESAIYFNTNDVMDLNRVAVYSALQIIISGFGIYLLRSTSISSRSTLEIGRQPNLAKSQWLPSLLAYFIAFLGFGYPVIHLFMRSLHFSYFNDLVTLGSQRTLSISLAAALFNSLRNALLSAIIALSIGLYGAQRSTRPWIKVILQIPLGVSTVVIGLGFLLTFTNGAFPLRGSWIVTPIAQSMTLIPLVIQILQPRLESIPDEFVDMATIDRVKSTQYWRHIALPQLKGALVLVSAYISIISIGEFGAANFLSYGNQSTLSTMLYALVSRPGGKNFGMALAASSLLILFVTSVLLVSERYEANSLLDEGC